MVLSRFPNAARNPIVLMLPSTGVPRVSGLASVRCRLLLGLFTGCAAHKRHAALVCAVAILSSQATAGFAQINTHHIGNSLTGQILGPNYSTRLRALTQVEGARQVSNQQDIRANRTLTHFVDVPVPDGSSAAHYGSAFANSKIDALFLQPWYEATIRQEAAAAVQLVRQLRLNPVNSETRVLVYSTWGSHTPTSSFVDTWTIGGLNLDSPFVPSAMAVEMFMAELKKDEPSAELIPVGEVFYEIGRRLQNGPITGLTAFEDLYGDSVHATNAGSYAALLAVYSVLYGKSPVGLGYPPQMLDPNFGYVLPEAGLLPMQQLVADLVAVPEPPAAVWIAVALAAFCAKSLWLRK